MRSIVLASTFFACLTSVTSALAAPETYNCDVQVNSGNLGSMMETVDGLFIDEPGKLIRFLTEGSDSKASTFNEAISQFHFGGNKVVAVSIGVEPIQIFTFDKKKKIATHSYVLPEGIAATTWSCQTAAPR